MSHGRGWLRDPHDARDLGIDRLLGLHAASPPPSSGSVADSRVPPKDQGASSSCTGFALSYAWRLDALRRGVDCPDLSALAAYAFALAEIYGPVEELYPDLGAYLRGAIRGCQRYGIPTEAAWSFSLDRVGTPPSFSALHSAFGRAGLKGYYRLPKGSADDVRRALASGHPVIGGWEINASFENWNGRGAIDAQHGSILGGHALCVDSYSADGTFSGCNSWGASWGSHGRYVVTEAFIKQGEDLWCVVTQ